jgi:aminoglycoside phosphotransferase family enzyme
MKNNTEISPLLTALLNPQFYPDKPDRVEYLQTHISMIFLTGKYVYKVKKPVDLGFVDYTTLDKRRYFCEQELELNRRLSPEIYLQVIPIT